MILISNNNGKVIAGCVMRYWRYVVVIFKDDMSIQTVHDVRYETHTKGKYYVAVMLFIHCLKHTQQCVSLFASKSLQSIKEMKVLPH